MDLYKTDPEFAERFGYFAFDEAVNEESARLEPSVRYMAVLAALIGSGGAEAYGEILVKALENGIAPESVKEIVYQSADYLGYACLNIGYGLFCACFRSYSDVQRHSDVTLCVRFPAVSRRNGERAEATYFGSLLGLCFYEPAYRAALERGSGLFP